MPINSWKYWMPSILSSALVSILGQYPDFIGVKHRDGNRWPPLSSLVSTFAIAATMHCSEDMVQQEMPSITF
jgi:hypothetical protein